MSGNVVPFVAPTPLLRYPEGLPPLDTDTIIIDSAADAVAVLAGLEWDAMTPAKREEARAWATLAATCLHAEGLQLVGYAMHLQTGHQPTDQPAPVRRSHVERLMAALRGAADRLIGAANPGSTANLVALIRQDTADAGWKAK